jgi:signal transduction histidine kinase
MSPQNPHIQPSGEYNFQTHAIKPVIQIAIFSAALFLTTSSFNYIRTGLKESLINSIVSATLILVGFLSLWLVKRGQYQLARRLFLFAYFLRGIHLMLLIPENLFPVAVMLMTVIVVVSVFLAAPNKGIYWIFAGLLSVIGVIFVRPYSNIPMSSIPDVLAYNIAIYFVPAVCLLITSLLCIFIYRQFHTVLLESFEARKQLEKTNKTLENFAYVASHDLQEPLRTITCYAQLLKQDLQGKLTQENEGSIHFILDGTQRMQRLIKDLLHYSSLKTQITELQPTSLNEVVAQVLKNLKTSLDESGAVLNIQDLPRVKAKHSQMVQLFQNLIGNAVKFRSDKSLQITLSAVRQEKTWLISVKDNGIGIEPEHHVKIFQIFSV